METSFKLDGGNMLKIDWPDCVLVVLGALERAGHESWAVGGCVRDALLGREPHDWDVCTAATPGEMRGALTGFRLLDTGEKHGTLTAMVHGAPIEITTFRADGAYTDHRHPDGVSFVRGLREDLARRDFTVNAMACHPERGIADYFGGQEDLRAGLIRCVGEADERFNEDGLRILRALRFAARFRFAIETQTAAALRKNRALLRFIARERVLSELRGMLLAPGAAEMLAAYPEVIAAAVPQLQTEGAMWERALRAVSRAPEDFAVRLALMVNEENARAVVDGLKTDNAVRGDVIALARRREGPLPEDAPGARRLLFELGDARGEKLCALWRAQRRAGADEAAAQVSAALARDDCRSLAQLKIGGRELAALGLRGPEIGETLRRLLFAVMDGRLENEAAALTAAAAHGAEKI